MTAPQGQPVIMDDGAQSRSMNRQDGRGHTNLQGAILLVKSGCTRSLARPTQNHTGLIAACILQVLVSIRGLGP